MNKLITNVSVAGVFLFPNFQSEMITQSLIWEELKILEQNRQWFKVKLFDDYEGWIYKFYIVKKHSKNNNSATYIETKPFGQIFNEPNSNSIPILNCPFGVTLPAIDTKR